MPSSASFIMFQLMTNLNCLRRPWIKPDCVSSRLYLMGILIAMSLLGNNSHGHDESNPEGKGGEPEQSAITGSGGGSSVPLGPTPCTNGFAGPYPCSGINLFSFLPLSSMGGTANGNDIWGWTSPNSGKDYAIVGRTDGTRFVDVSDPTSPIYLGNLAGTGNASTTWRDIKVYKDHAYIVADGSAHGLQVFSLTQLDALDRNSPPVTLQKTAQYNEFTNAHNIVINEDSGFAYAVGTNSFGGGLHAINIQNPASPVAAGGFSADGYTHDAQAVTYRGPDQDFVGQEIVFASNGNSVTIVDVTNKNSQQEISRTSYPNAKYIHQGWLTEDQRYFLQNDELDELQSSKVTNTRTHIWDMKDLQNPLYMGFYGGTTTAIDHNLYTQDGLVYESNYSSGLRVLDLKDVRNADLTEIGYFDVVPSTNASSFNGAWSVYKFEDSGTVILNGREQGLFVLDTQDLVAGTPTQGVINGSFERVLGPNGTIILPNNDSARFDGTVKNSTITEAMIPGWFLFSGGRNRGLIYNVTEGQFLGGDGDLGSGDSTSSQMTGFGVPDGINALGLRNADGQLEIRSVLADLLEMDTLYSLSVFVGQSAGSTGNAGYEIALFSGDVELGRIRDTDLGAPGIPIGTFAPVSLTIDSRDFESVLGLPLEIRLATEATKPADFSTYFDSVTLQSIPLNSSLGSMGVPEPGAAIFLLLSCWILHAIRRQRYHRRRVT